MASVFAYQSSEVDWCEDNYQHSDKVAEFYNTVSSMSFFFFAPVMMYLLHPYARERSQAVHLIWVMVMIVGIFSAYYHMTLSYVGQLLDEIAILWVLAIGYTLWFPRRHFPAFIKSRSHFAWLVFFTASVSTVMSFAKPTVNAYALNSVTLHILYVLTLEMRRHILISIAVAHGTTLFAYFDAIYEIPEAQPEVKYWPSASREIGLPYLAVKNKEKTQKCC
ncbi:alkaline ceramidase 1 isoform X2 [Latimeria chalumnae]|uniref:alkaline ceramidase 1 isoform X2 n=1 Tax=Latimeria chalumnae TaxID=7897 RepID=UPI0003C1278D|nr:PREDICTED: alkaline ceramidase 1 isoform X2 [Latimeria chalumnae]|eukprot:XP_005989896.1 PREDICTED: alkaline ceramidase 1 isoform X2 [Latimeria chalumnae]